MKSFFTKFSFSLFVLFLASNLAAKEITLYEQANDSSPATGKVDLSIGVIPIFTPKDSTWMKVADPRNGNVGWVKTNEIYEGGVPASVTFTQKITSDGKGQPHSYQIIEFGNQKNLNSQQVHDMMQKLQMQQQMMQRSMQKAVQDMIKSMNDLYHEEGSMFDYPHLPFVMPILVVPAKAPPKKENELPQAVKLLKLPSKITPPQPKSSNKEKTSAKKVSNGS